MSKIDRKKKLTDSFYRFLWKNWKERRFKRFIRTMKPTSTCQLLDIGGYPEDWFTRGEHIAKVDLLNLDLSVLGEIPPASPQIRVFVGDARNLEFPDGSYDIVFSNSVIEHVGNLDDQRAFANEARRVGAEIWIQTPAKLCPIEPHYMGLFIHWFPSSWQVSVARWTSLRGLSGSASRQELQEIAATTRFLSKREFSSMFPDCEIWTEKLFWVFPKSYVAIRSAETLSASTTLKSS